MKGRLHRSPPCLRGWGGRDLQRQAYFKDPPPAELEACFLCLHQRVSHLLPNNCAIHRKGVRSQGAAHPLLTPPPTPTPLASVDDAGGRLVQVLQLHSYRIPLCTGLALSALLRCPPPTSPLWDPPLPPLSVITSGSPEPLIYMHWAPSRSWVNSA